MTVEKQFDKDAFLDDIREEMAYLGMKLSELAIRAKIPQKRFICLMNNKAKFKKQDIEAIENVLGMN